VNTGQSIEDLQQQLAAAQREAQLLRAELDETNTGVVALYAELDDKAIQLDQSLQLRSRFLSYMSHEFRTPLTAVTSISNILLQQLDGPLSVEQTRQVEFIRSSVLELTEMVNDLLDLAKIDAGRVAIAPEWFEMVDLFSALRGMFKPILSQSAVDLILEETGSMPRIYTDDKKLSHILRNFISNALKFTREGEVRVSARQLPDDQIEFSVTDTGIGIPEDQISSLFVDFVQLDNVLQKRLRGSGIGLSLSKRFAELLGGRVGVQSEVGKGSRFWVIIPVQFAGDASPQAAS